MTFGEKITSNMPKIISYTPSWLSRPSPGFHLFSTSIDEHDGRGLNHQTNGESNPRNCIGPKRTIARRGTEIFAVVDNQIRWSDLCMLKEGWEELQGLKKKKAKSSRDRANRQSVEENTAKPNFRVLMKCFSLN